MGSVLSLSTTQTVVALFLLATSINYCLSTFTDPRRRLPRPPGPKGYPVIGSLFDHPTARPWLTYGDWTKKYGDMIYYEVLGQPILVLNSVRRINDLFDKRSKNYSDRPRFPMLAELMHWDVSFASLNGNWWKRHRRQFHQHFNPGATPKYIPIQVEEIRTFARRLVTANDLYSTIRWTFAAIIMRVTYGIPVESINSEYAQRVELAFAGLSEAGVAGKYLVDRFPIMKHIPAWFPGAEFKRKAARWYSINRDIRKLPFERVRKEMGNVIREQGIAPPSVAASLISAPPPLTDPSYAAEESISENVAAVAYLGGADTAVAPLAVPHSTTEDDEYDGYFIPKGTIVFGNSWAILHDEGVFGDPFVFRPERYLDASGEHLDESVLDPADGGAFGFGRRICPGRYIGGDTLFLIVSTILAVYNITPKLDKDGCPKKMVYKYTDGVICYPEPFEVDINPRTDQAAALIHAIPTSGKTA